MDDNTSCTHGVHRLVHNRNYSDVCFYVKYNNSDCLFDDGFIPYITIIYCSFAQRGLLALGIVLLFAFLLVLLNSLAITADQFFGSSIIVVTKFLRLSDNLAGVTLLAFGNGSPDIFSAIAATTGMKNGDAGLIYGALLGAGMFVTTVTVASISFISRFKPPRRPLAKDIIFYMLAILINLSVLLKRRVTIYDSLGCIILYIIYVCVTFFSKKIRLRFFKVPETSCIVNNDNEQQIRNDIIAVREEVPRIIQSYSNTAQEPEYPAFSSQANVQTTSAPQQVCNNRKKLNNATIPDVIIHGPIDDNHEITHDIVPMADNSEVILSTGNINPSFLQPPILPISSRSYDDHVECRIRNHEVKQARMSSSYTSKTHSYLTQWVMMHREVEELREVDRPILPRKRTTVFQNRDDNLTTETKNRRNSEGLNLKKVQKMKANAINEDKISSRRTNQNYSSAIQTTQTFPNDTAYLRINNYNLINTSNTQNLTPIFTTDRFNNSNIIAEDEEENKVHVNNNKQYLESSQEALISDVRETLMNAKRILKLMFFELLDCLNPIDTANWASHSIGNKMYEIISAPLKLILTIFTPLVDIERPMNGWVKMLQCIQCLVTPLLWMLLTEVTTIYLNNVFPVYALFIIFGVLLCGLVFATTHYNSKPVYHIVFAFASFATSVLWIYTIANEVVNILTTIGVVFHFSPAVLGLTLLSWANSIGDLMSNSVLAKNNFPRIAISACFGGPLFNLLIGIGIPFTIVVLKQPNYSIPVEMNLVQVILVTFLLATLTLNLIFIQLYDSRYHKLIGITLILVYVTFIVLAVLAEVRVIPSPFDKIIHF